MHHTSLPLLRDVISMLCTGAEFIMHLLRLCAVEAESHCCWVPVVQEFMGRLLVLLLQLVLTVDVARVGTFAMLPNATMTPRSLVPLEGDVSENEELMKMSGLMIYVSQYILSLPNRHGVQCLSTTNAVRVHASLLFCTSGQIAAIEPQHWPYVVSRAVCYILHLNRPCATAAVNCVCMATCLCQLESGWHAGMVSLC